MDNKNYYPVTSDRLRGKLRKYHIQITIIFYLTIVAIVGLTIYGFLNPGTVFHFGFYYQLFLMGLFLYFIYLPPLPHNYKHDTSKEMSYHFEDDALVIRFNNSEKLRVPYTTINGFKPLTSRLKRIKSINAVGRHFWISPKNMVGFSDEYPALIVYSTSISGGLLLNRKFEKILISPEKQDDFIKELQSNLENLTVARS
ncbi:PH domain-containing protein [Salipaludibacillus sp. HK11]|uniref:PH domain-containing protein n=1 Tax=Salipaludibacillus sp. HK11 TaxID=3394320 RepID=UPI0039FC700D